MAKKTNGNQITSKQKAGKRITGIISQKKAQNLIWNFHHECHAHSICVTFNINDLFEYVDRTRNKGADQLRVYFGQYGKNVKPEDKTHWGHITTVFIPLTAGVEDNNEIFNEGTTSPPPTSGTLNHQLYLDVEDPMYDPTSSNP